jgi:RNA polymerase sigma-70 factor, ECF subfamily
MNDELQRQLPQLLPRLWRFALRLTRHQADAEDLLQRCCLRALEKRGQWRPDSVLLSWLFSIMHSIWLNELRSAQRRREGSLDVEVQIEDFEDQGTAGDPEYQLLCRQVVDAVEALPEAQRVVMILVAAEGFSYREAAQILEVPIGTVMSRLSRGRLTVGSRFLHRPGKDAAPEGSRHELR